MKIFLLISVLIIDKAGFGQLISSDLKYRINILFDKTVFQKEIKQSPMPAKIKFLTIHGDVSYDFFYRSKMDTPFAQQNFQQHTEKINLNILLKEKYPLKVSFALRQSNSPYFRNFNDINFQFDQYGFQKNIKQNILDKLSRSLENRTDLKELESLITEQEKEFLGIKKWLENPITLQKIIEEREREFQKKLQQKELPVDSFLNTRDANFPGKEIRLNDSGQNKFNAKKEKLDSLKSTFAQLYDNKKKKLDSVSERLKVMHRKTDSIKNAIQKNIANARKIIYKAGSQKEMIKMAADNGLNLDLQDRFESKLAAIRRFSIGRSMINYTELTAQNITLTGLNIEYNRSYYAAFAAGKIDYRFRDFYNKSTNNNSQYLVLGRIGIGNLDKRALILTIFEGRKNSSGYSVYDTVTNQINIVGYSIESIFKKDENTSISFEVAKSTKPVTGSLRENKQINSLWKFNDQSNMGINVKAQTVIPETNTKLSGFFRKTGENFQSFSLFSYNTDQVAWVARADQYFFKEKVTVTGMLRRNDFTNPFTDKTYKTSTVFKSILVNVRIPKYPSLSLGYYPGSQLYVVNKEIIRENAYYILNGSVTYSYFHKRTAMNSSFIYNQYFNKATDSGFVLYKGTTYYAMQTISFKKLQLQGGYSYNSQPELKFFTVEASGDYSVKQVLRVGIGGKYNKISGGNIYWGNRLQLTADFKQLGILKFQYEKSYLPTVNHTLYPVETGRVSWYKYF